MKGALHGSALKQVIYCCVYLMLLFQSLQSSSSKGIPAGARASSRQISAPCCSACRRGGDALVCLASCTLGGQTSYAFPCASEPGCVCLSWNLLISLALVDTCPDIPFCVLSHHVAYQNLSCTDHTRRGQDIRLGQICSTTGARAASRQDVSSSSFFLKVFS